MKKEKWLLQQIELWQEKGLVDEETALRLSSVYQEKKSINFLTVLFSVIGSLLIGMGIVLVSANNWWYALPIFIRAFIGFLPLVVSLAVVFFVFDRKMHSNAFRESAALLNMAGVFASIAIVGQIFHLPGDFTNYLLVSGLLFLPTMLILDAISPLIVFFWTAINGGICFSDEWGVVISAVLFSVGAVFALNKCRIKSGKGFYLSLLTAVSAFIYVLTAALYHSCDLSVVLYGYALLLLSTAPLLEGCEDAFESLGRIIFIILTFVVTYQGLWGYTPDFDSPVFGIITALMILSAVVFFIKNVRKKECSLFSAGAFIALMLRLIWCIFGLSSSPFDMIFMIVFNIILFALSIICIIDGARRVDLYNANTGMVTLCALIVMRFFDSGLPLYARGIVFLILGFGFLFFNLYLVRSKKGKEA